MIMKSLIELQSFHTRKSFLLHMFLTKQFVAERMIGSGGMPSSHSATVCALATATGMVYGGGSFEFAIAVILAIIVMHDAMGVRRETGIQAKVINEMLEVFTNMGKKMSPEEQLKEFVGHTPIQTPQPIQSSGLNCILYEYPFIPIAALVANEAGTSVPSFTRTGRIQACGQTKAHLLHWIQFSESHSGTKADTPRFS